MEGATHGPGALGRARTLLSDLELLVGLSHPLVSHHLRILKAANLVEVERRGRWTVYRPRAERVVLLAESLRSVGTSLPLSADPGSSAA